MEDARNTFDGLSSEEQPEYNSKLKVFISEYDIKKQNFNKLQESYQKEDRLNKLKTGQLSRGERVQAERDYAVELHKETDIQGDIINDIGKDIRGANENLGEIAVAVDEQGKQIDRIHGKVLADQGIVKGTDKRTKSMVNRATCTKALLWITNIIIFLAIVCVVGIKGRNHYVCTHKKSS